MKKPTLSNVLLGIIAAEVIYLTAQAIAERFPAEEATDGPEEQPEPKQMGGDSMWSRAWHQAVTMLKRYFSEEGSDFPDTARRSWQQPGSNRLRDVRSGGGKQSGQSAGRAQADRADEEEGRDESHDADHDGLHLHGSMQGISEKMKDPAWAGMLAANGGDIALTDAARAVPMPKSARFVQRLDRNPYVGKGMRNHSKDLF